MASPINAKAEKDFWEYYSRQTVLPDLSVEGQRRLRDSRVVVVGLGGLGTASALYLALAGVGFLRLVDQDVVDYANLHRQILYATEDVGYSKVEVAAKTLTRINPFVKVEPIADNVNASNVDTVVEGMDAIVDGLDNMRTRYLLNKASVRRRVPFIAGGAVRFEGNVSVLHPPDTACLECVFGSITDESRDSCETLGVLGATPGIIGSIQAMETVKILTGIGESLKGRFLICDFRYAYFSVLDLPKNPACPVCGKPSAALEKPTPTPSSTGRQLAWLCGQDTANVNPPAPMTLDLNELYDAVSREFKVTLRSSFVLGFNYDEKVEVSLFKNGRMLLKQVDSEEKAWDIYSKLAAKLHLF
ncbi:MAG: ThiF family adenylyltransferase [Candidatus Bathyarchaeia archaeon]